MILRIALALLFALPGLSAKALCTGNDLIAGLTPKDRVTLTEMVAQHPNASGNLWRARKPGSIIHIIGTLHLYDPRMAAMMTIIGPLIDQSDLVMVEAGRDEIAALKRAVATQPDLLLTSGPTLPEILTKPEWTALSAELKARGIPPFMAAKLQPWYVSTVLGMPACAVSEMTSGVTGLDELVMQRAEASEIPIKAVEPYDTVFQIFGDLTQAEQIAMIRASMASAAEADDMFATLQAAYFAGHHREIWEFTRMQVLQTPGSGGGDFALLETAMLTSRNRAWMQIILPQAGGHSTVIAVGAAHLSGADGILNLLAQAGYTLEQLPL